MDKANATTANPSVAEIAKELGLEALPAEQQEAMVVKMTEVLLKRIFVETMEKLSETDRSVYEQMADRGAKEEELEGFLRSKISGYAEMVKGIIDDFKAEMRQQLKK